jgi:hypothetical protein
MIRDVCGPMWLVIGWRGPVSSRFAVKRVRESRIARVLVGETVMLARGRRRA